MKVIAMYLPQFHRVLENDIWWGEGYTEWTAVRSAEKLYENHYQPRIPLNHNYYDLMQKETMQWQSELMKKYNVYGMCFYHYYFQNGRKILEKPAENLLKWKDIDMPFCFSWANVSWARTWSKILEKNSWNNVAELKQGEDDDGILLRQDYGGEKEWREHFNYLVPFFMDDRYIKIDGKPVLIIYRADSIPCLPLMMEVWNKAAKQNNINGLYFIATNSERQGFDAYLHQEATYTKAGNKDFIVDYDELCTRIIESAVLSVRNHMLCGFAGFDDTPRKGKNGQIIESTPDQFYNLMRKLLYLSDIAGNEFIFVNAWNEWGEGMYLEPDEKYGYGYLEALKRALSDYKDMDGEEWNILKILADKGNGKTHSCIENTRTRRSNYLMRLFDKWLCLKENGKSLQLFFDQMGYRHIAIYGFGAPGSHLIADLNKEQTKIVYGIDRLGNKLKQNFPVYTLEDDLPDVDVIVVSVTYDFDSIYESLKDKFDGPVVSLEEVVDCVERFDRCYDG